MRLSTLLNLNGITIKTIESTNNSLLVNAFTNAKRANCPLCKESTNKIHDRYYRRIRDLNVLQHRVGIKLRVRKFKCLNCQCPRKVFAEPLCDVAPYARRTLRLDHVLNSIALETSSSQGQFISRLLSVAMSRSTMSRKAHQVVLPPVKTPRVLGVDDWAIRKGVNYGTVLVDMETSRPIDLLPSRDAEDLKRWLKNHKGIEIVTRDRASSYASAITEIHPEVNQVADRFHLLMNLSDALNEYFKSNSGRIKKMLAGDRKALLSITDKCSGSVETTKTTPKKKDYRQESFDMVKDLQCKNYPIKTIARHLGMSRNTVRQYFQYEELPARTPYHATNFLDYAEFVLYELAKKGHVKKEIIKKIREMGYNGSQTQAYHNINQLIKDHKIQVPDSKAIYQKPIAYLKPISPRKLVKLITQKPSQIMDKQQSKYMELLLEKSGEIRHVRRLVMYFREMIRNRRGNIEKWTQLVRSSEYELTGLKTLAKGISQDLKAVKNAIKWSWSNGPVEGHVNRIKTIKRQMYGRAGFELLRKKVILSGTG